MPLVEAAQQSLRALKTNICLNAFISLYPEQRLLSEVASTAKQSTGPLSGRLIAVKDNICTTELPTSCASEMLREFTSPYEATVVHRLHEAGGVVMGKTNMDEFGMGSHSTYSAFGQVHGLSDGKTLPLSAGGSSGGSAAAVAAGMCFGALGTDTGGSVRLPASYCGVIGFKPSYGMVSRWGVVAYANSLDTVGVFGRSSETVKSIFDVINGYDSKDPTSISPKVRQRIQERLYRHRQRTAGPLRIGLPLEYNVAELTPAVRTAWQRTLKSLATRGHVICPVSLSTTRQALSAYYVLAPAEASSNLAKYDGLRYGHRDTQDRSLQENVLFAPTRASSFGEEVRRRILLGAYTLSAGAIDNYFIKAQAVRRLVQRDFDRVFRAKNYLQVDAQDPNENGVDVLISPTTLSTAPTLKDVHKKTSPLDSYVNDVLTVPASLAGIPVLSIPVPVQPDKNGNGPGTVGMQVMAQYGDEQRLWDVAKNIEGV